MAKRAVPVTILAAALAFASPLAAASLVHFETGGSDGVAFVIAQRPNPSASVDGTSFTIANVHGTFGGVAGVRSIDFFSNTGNGGGFQVAGGQGIFSQQVYAGTEVKPFIYTGDYFASDRATGNNVGLIVYPTDGTIPEPASWALLVAGFGLTGAALRARGQRAVTA